ncbi:MAG: putative rane protein ArfC [Mycobacterium sp.]|jgi:uncharacterized membrane protein ArfC|nr:putative rane protein ArfC [Mycobacterium sp.]
MNHVPWWLLAFSFVAGLVFTLALMVRPVRSQVPVGTSAGESDSDADIEAGVELPTTKIRAPKEPPTSKIAVALPVGKDAPTTKIPVAKDTPTTKIPVAAKESPTTKIPVVPFAPYGPGSARADNDGGGPSGWLVKGRSDTRLYYTPDDATYDQTTAQVWFKDEESAAGAYFTPWRTSKRK